MGILRREWALLSAAVLVAALTGGVLAAFNNNESSHRQIAATAAAAELAAWKAYALGWESTAAGRLTPATAAQLIELAGSVQRDLHRVGAGGAQAGKAVAGYSSVIAKELRLITAGKTTAGGRAEVEKIAPVFARIDAFLKRVAVKQTEAADTAATVVEVGDLVAVGIGFAVVAALLLRFGATRRALVAARTEQQVLREIDNARSNLVSVVSHDLRTPLTSITGYLEILTDEEAGPVTDQQRRILAVMQRSAGRLLTIVSDLLFISRSQAGRIDLALEETDLGAAVAEGVEGQRPLAWQHGVDLRVSTSPSPPVMADRHRVDELIENLLSNALKFTPAGGAVDVAVRPAGGRVRLQVSDTGIGISQDDQKHLFEQFFRSAKVVGMPGVGLGLAITKVIADAHQATISVASTPGMGTTFCVEFLAVTRPPVADRDPSADASRRA